MMTVGPMEIIIVVAVIALLFGANKLPELAKTAGTTLREFNDARTSRSSGTADAGDGSAAEADGEAGKGAGGRESGDADGEAGPAEEPPEAAEGKPGEKRPAEDGADAGEDAGNAPA